MGEGRDAEAQGLSTDVKIGMGLSQLEDSRPKAIQATENRVVGCSAGQAIARGRMPGELASNTDLLGAGDVDAIAAVVLKRRMNVEAIDAMGGEGLALAGGFEADNLHAQRSHRCLGEVEGAAESVIGTDMGAECGSTQEVESRLDLGDGILPRFHGEGGVHAAEGRD